MSKFRARQLDATKPIPIYLQEDISDYSDLNNASNRTVPQMPTGMEKEEETVSYLHCYVLVVIPSAILESGAPISKQATLLCYITFQISLMFIQYKRMPLEF